MMLNILLKGGLIVRKFAICFLALLLALPFSAGAEALFEVAGFDGSSSGRDWNENFFFERMEERTGLALNLTQYNDAEEWTDAKAKMRQGGEMPDVLLKAQLTGEETQKMYEEGVLIDLKPYLKDNAPNLTALLENHPEWERAITLPSGAMVALPALNELQSNNAIWVNTEWLKNVGLEMPTTAEEFAEMLRAFKTKDPNRNGKADEIPLVFTGMWDLRFLAHAFGIYSNDYYVVAEDGQVRETVTSDENRAFITWLHELWAEGLMDPMGFLSTDSTRKITDSKAEITFGVVFGPSMMNMLPSEQVGNYALMMPLTYEGRQVYRDLLGDVVRGTFAITSACEDPAAMVRWVDFLYSEEGCFLAQAGMEGEEWERLDNGNWNWLDDHQHVAEVILPEYTISEGAPAPGYTPIDYQRTFDEETTHRAVESMLALKEKSVSPYPLIYLDEATQKRVNEIWADLGDWAETAMARFVCGDVALNDETWADFCQTVSDKGMGELLSIWQKALE